MKKPRIPSNYRLSELARNQIKDIAKNLEISEAKVIEELAAWYFRNRIISNKNDIEFLPIDYEETIYLGDPRRKTNLKKIRQYRPD